MQKDPIEPVLNIDYYVSAYDESGYGDNRSREFKDGDAAVEYAKSLDKRFHAIVIKQITMQPIRTVIYDAKNS